MKHCHDGDGTGTVVFIPGYQDIAALWDEVIDRLPTPGWCARAVNLRHVDEAGRLAEARSWRATATRSSRCSTTSIPPRRAQWSSWAKAWCTGCRTCRSGTAKHRGRAGADHPGSARGLPANPRAGSPLRSRSARSHCGLAAANRRALLVNDSARVMRTLVGATLSTPTVVAAQELDAWTAGHPLGDQPSAVSTPVLLIDSEDTFSSAELIRVVVAPRFTDARTVHVSGAGHWPHVEQPAAVTKILDNFLTSLARPASAATT
jgi:pimeloyl-ACP methyl ester carboxylesterase